MVRFLSPVQAGAQPAALRPLQAAIADRATSPARIVVWGDSVSEGEGVATFADRWTNRWQDALRGAFPTPGVRGGIGYLPAYYVSSSIADTATQDSSAPAGGTPTFATDTQYGLGGKTIHLKNGAALVWTQECTSFRVHYAKGPFGVPFTVQVDGVTIAASVATSNASLDGGYVWDSTSVTTLTPGVHTIRIRTTDTAGFISSIHGVEFRYDDEASGIHVIDATRSGAVSTSFGAAHFASHSRMGNIHGVVTQLLTNDAVLFAQTPAQYQTNIGNHIDAVDASISNPYTHVLMLPPIPTATLTSGYTWADFIKAAAAAVAARSHAVLVTMADWLGPSVAADTLSLWSDGVHMSARGHALTAERLSDVLRLRGNGVAVQPRQRHVVGLARRGTLAVTAGKSAVYNDTGSPWRMIAARAQVSTAPTGTALTVQVKVDGANAFTIVIPAGQTTGVSAPTSTVIPDGSKITADITQVGSTAPGTDLSLTLTAQSDVFVRQPRYTLPYSKVGTLAVGTGKFALWNDTGASWRITTARAQVDTAPTGAALNLAVKVDGVSAFTFSVGASATTGSATPSAVTVPNGSKVTVDITQVGSTVPGADLSVTLTAQSAI